MRPLAMTHVFNKHRDLFLQHPGMFAHWMARIGMTHLRVGNWFQAIRWTTRSLACRPDSNFPRHFLWWLASLAGPVAVPFTRKLGKPFKEVENKWKKLVRKKKLRRKIPH
jgi:hypothetical protein